MIEYVKGDLFAANERVIAHGCNCHGVMGAGVAAIVRSRYPYAYNAYVSECDYGGFYPGVAQPVDCRKTVDEDSFWVYNLATQNAPGRNAQYWMVEQAFRNMKNHMDFVGNQRVAMPMIGAGIGGLEWKRIHDILVSVFMLHNTNYQIVVYYLKDEDLPDELK